MGVTTNGSVKHLLGCTKMLMQRVHYVEQTFHLVPGRNHIGTCIDYIDLQECRREFCEELINTVADWVYNQKKASEILQDLENEGRSKLNAHQAFASNVLSKFRRAKNDKVVQQGQFGELLLFNFLQHFFSAVPLMRKMPITTNVNMERFGADAIHYNFDNGKHLIYLGEAKAYTSKYSFASAFKDALTSILTSFSNHRAELKHYIYDSFIDESLADIARNYQNGKLETPEVHLVSLIVYHESSSVTANNAIQIRKNIMDVISAKGKALKRDLFNPIPPNLYPRFNYIILPIWEFDELMEDFKKLIGQ